MSVLDTYGKRLLVKRYSLSPLLFIISNNLVNPIQGECLA
jgi:hypothetical protein